MRRAERLTAPPIDSYRPDAIQFPAPDTTQATSSSHYQTVHTVGPHYSPHYNLLPCAQTIEPPLSSARLDAVTRTHARTHSLGNSTAAPLLPPCFPWVFPRGRSSQHSLRPPPVCPRYGPSIIAIHLSAKKGSQSNTQKMKETGPRRSDPCICLSFFNF